MSSDTSVGSESDREQWRAAVAGVLAKSSRKDPAELGEAPEQLLDSPTYEGFPIRPLYTILDSQPEAPLPGQVAVHPRFRCAARREVRLEGRRGVSRRLDRFRWPTETVRCCRR